MKAWLKGGLIGLILGVITILPFGLSVILNSLPTTIFVVLLSIIVFSFTGFILSHFRNSNFSVTKKSFWFGLFIVAVVIVYRAYNDIYRGGIKIFGGDFFYGLLIFPFSLLIGLVILGWLADKTKKDIFKNEHLINGAFVGVLILALKFLPLLKADNVFLNFLSYIPQKIIDSFYLPFSIEFPIYWLSNFIIYFIVGGFLWLMVIKQYNYVKGREFKESFLRIWWIFLIVWIVSIPFFIYVYKLIFFVYIFPSILLIFLILTSIVFSLRYINNLKMYFLILLLIILITPLSIFVDVGTLMLSSIDADIFAPGVIGLLISIAGGIGLIFHVLFSTIIYFKRKNKKKSLSFHKNSFNKST